MNNETSETKQAVWGGSAIPPAAEIDGKLRELAARLEAAYSAAKAKGALVEQGIVKAIRELRILPGQAPRPDMALFADDAGMEKLLQQRLVLHQVRAGVCMVLLQAASGALESTSREFQSSYGSGLDDTWVKLVQATWLEGIRKEDRAMLAIEWAYELTGTKVEHAVSDTVLAGRRILRNVYDRAEGESRLQIHAFRGRTLELLGQAKVAADASLATYAGEDGMRRLLEDRLRVIAETQASANACIQVAQQIAGKACDPAVETIETSLPDLPLDLRLQLAIEEGLGLSMRDPSVQALLKGQLFLAPGAHGAAELAAGGATGAAAALLAAGAGPIWCRRHGERGVAASR